MGCASSKPSKSKKESKKLSARHSDATATETPTAKSGGDEPPISLDTALLAQIRAHEARVVEYIGRLVQRHLQPDHPHTDTAPILDVASKAIALLITSPLTTATSLNTSLRAWKFPSSHTPTHTTHRIIDLTCDTIAHCLRSISEELRTSEADFDLLKFIAEQGHTLLLDTPPPSPDTHASHNEENGAVLLNRTKANQIARLLFLSDKARPVIHASSRVKDAYFVNRELSDKRQVMISEQEIEDILNNSTYKNNPHITPVTGRKLDLVCDMLPRSFSVPEADNELVGNVEAENVAADDTEADIEASLGALEEPCDYEREVGVVLREEVSEGAGVESTDTEVVVVGEETVAEAHMHFLESIVDEINGLGSMSCDPEQVEAVGETTVTPPSTPEVRAEDAEEEVEEVVEVEVEEVVEVEEADLGAVLTGASASAVGEETTTPRESQSVEGRLSVGLL